MQYALSVNLVCQAMITVTWGLRISESEVPRTAFCISGNVRGGHSLPSATLLKQRLDGIDDTGIVFAYVNPCLPQTKPWRWDRNPETKGTEWIPPPCDQNARWNNSYFRSTLRPEKLQEYGEDDVAPPTRDCKNGSPEWMRGVHQEAMTIKKCFEMVEAYEKEHQLKFSWVVRIRPDACTKQRTCNMVQYCKVTELDPSKAHVHLHFNGTAETGGPFLLFDQFAVVPRHLADTYFNYVNNYMQCPSKSTFIHQGDIVLGEEVISSWLIRSGKVFPFTDDCKCHKFPTITCHGGPTWMSFAKSFQGYWQDTYH
eukprot:gnl/MRDRNA2_/MRDRNA2_84981_c0_seq10.p1 gnl/MRDRNA2_/MRDRNA2_84981_c0~~gnl/MRDRNA2_/MRDRNA2_84981_c0_seq10.p1  ORF type:complete len:312 (-),score=35.61 gnl/MRDRNA2_/MRDRNA2_84981_c0_seq10:62-997(-)